MASTDTQPITITIDVAEGGTVVWTPGPHGQEHLQSVLAEDMERVLEEVRVAVARELVGLTGAICGVVNPEVKERMDDLLVLSLLSELLYPSGLNDDDNPMWPFRR